MQSKTPKVFVIVLNYNGIKTLSSCISSVFQSDYPNFETVIVDNDSKDGSFEMIKQQFQKAHFIKNHSNLGFAAGNNVAIRFALEKFADYILLLNNDATIEKNTISELVKQTTKDSCGISSPVIYKDSNSVWFAGGKIKWLQMRTEHVFSARSKEPYSSEYICGCAMFISKEVFKKVGLFDEKFFLYYEDADFSLRSKKKGFSLKIIPSAKAFHQESSSGSTGKTYWLVLSALLFFKKHTPASKRFFVFCFYLLRRTKNLFDLLLKRNSTAIEVHRAFRDYSKK